VIKNEQAGLIVPSPPPNGRSSTGCLTLRTLSLSRLFYSGSDEPGSSSRREEAYPLKEGGDTRILCLVCAVYDSTPHAKHDE
jgi:hypothetical protein